MPNLLKKLRSSSRRGLLLNNKQVGHFAHDAVRINEYLQNNSQEKNKRKQEEEIKQPEETAKKPCIVRINLQGMKNILFPYATGNEEASALPPTASNESTQDSLNKRQS